MPGFVNPYLMWGMALLAVPVVIHLINLMRHRRIEWAAMEFLLQSQRKNSTWIRLKELLLLLMRMAAIAAVVLILAQPLLDYQLAARLGGQRTHHVVLLDDSYSMSDRFGDSSSFDQAKGAIERLGEQIALQGTPQNFTLLRFSKATANDTGTPADLLEQTVTADFKDRLATALAQVEVSQTAARPLSAIEEMERILGEPDGEQRIVYLLSDFRTRQWDEPGELLTALKRLEAAGSRLQLVHCTDALRDNLAITSLAPRVSTQAAGVPMNLALSVHNHGTQLVKNVSVTLEEDGTRRPALVFDEIKPGETETRVFQANFATAGQHYVSARIESDAVAADNVRYLVVDLPTSVPVLLIDASRDPVESATLSDALAPGGMVKTGMVPQIEPPSFLNNSPLDKFAVIYLVNFESLDEAAVNALEAYAKAGGSIVVFTGPMAQVRFINERLYRDGEGFFPAPLEVSTHLLVDRLQRTPDIEPAEHPAMRVFAGERNPFLADVLIDRFFAVPRAWTPPADSGIHVAARLRGGLPLMIDRPFGEGRVVAILTSAGTSWNNWAGNPSYIVSMLELQAYLAYRPFKASDMAVGAPVALDLDSAEFSPQMRVNPPADHPQGAVLIDGVVEDERLKLRYLDTSHAGIYELQLTRSGDQPDGRLLAVNVDPAEGNLALLQGEELASRLGDLKYDLWRAERFSLSDSGHAGTNWSQWILFGLIGLLLGEQVLAYSASYHPKAMGGART